MSYGILASVLVCSLSIAGQMQRTMFGISVRWESPRESVLEQIEKEIERIGRDGHFYYDPDCLYRKPLFSGDCPNPFQDKVSALHRLSQIFRAETSGYFDVNHRNAFPPKRDLGGIWQGDALDSIRESVDGEFVLDFAGDIYVSGSNATQRRFIVSDPVFDELQYATVDIDRGYMIASSSRRLGGTVRTPENLSANSRKEGENILKVVLFSHSDFSGARLDAWSTAVIAGGVPVLKKLESLKEFEGKWGYFYFEPNGTPHCSAHLPAIRCDLQSENRHIEVRFHD